MARIPLEDDFTDIIGKAQRGRRMPDDKLCQLAGVTPEDLAALKSGRVIDAALRRVARHLGLSPDALQDIAHRRWYPELPNLQRGFALFSTQYGDMRVNSYLVWDERTRAAAVFDTGADATEMIDVARAERLKVGHIFLTHAHEDHIADLPRLAKETGAQVWSSEREPAGFPGERPFPDNAYFHVGSLAVKALLTWGHSPGLTTFFVTGLSRPLAIVGDALFAGSIGGSAEHFAEQHRNDVERIFTLPRDTALACGHGPLSTLAQEKAHNPFFCR